MKKANILFIVILALYFLVTLIKFFMVPYGLSPLFQNLVIATCIIMAIFAYSHAIYTMKTKAIIFILLIVGVAILGEIFTGIQAQHGSYYYTSFLLGPRIAGFPLFIAVIMHMTHFYIVYCVINYIFSRDRRNLWWPIIAILAVAYGSCALALDSAREAIYGGAHSLGVWVYPQGGILFGVSIRTLIYWFVWATVWLGLFLIYESRISRGKIFKPDFLPVVAYFLLMLTFVSEALVVRQPQLAIIEIAAMLPFLVISLLVASRTWKDRKAVESNKIT
jgi:hypothetical protein